MHGALLEILVDVYNFFVNKNEGILYLRYFLLYALTYDLLILFYCFFFIFNVYSYFSDAF